MKSKTNGAAFESLFKRVLKAFFSFLFFAAFLASPAAVFTPDYAMAARPLMGDPNAPQEGSAAPAICVLEPGGLKEVLISFDKPAKDGPGAPALVWFWFMSCENCVKDMKFMREIHKKYKSRLSLIAVNVDKPDRRGTVKNFIKNNGISGYDNYYDKITEHVFSADYDASDKFAIYSTPALFIIDKNGKIILRAEGHINFDLVEQKLETIVKSE